MMGYGWDGGALGWIWMLGGLLVMVGFVVLIVWAVGAGPRLVTAWMRSRFAVPGDRGRRPRS